MKGELLSNFHNNHSIYINFLKLVKIVRNNSGLDICERLKISNLSN